MRPFPLSEFLIQMFPYMSAKVGISSTAADGKAEASVRGEYEAKNLALE